MDTKGKNRVGLYRVAKKPVRDAREGGMDKCTKLPQDSPDPGTHEG